MIKLLLVVFERESSWSGPNSCFRWILLIAVDASAFDSDVLSVVRIVEDYLICFQLVDDELFPSEIDGRVSFEFAIVHAANVFIME